jgi:drug/metabolite transporter (DMT)-like permease
MTHPLSPDRRSPAKGILFMSLSVLLFTVMSVMVKQASEHVPLLEIVFFRNAAGMVPVMIAVAWSGGLQELKTERFPAHLGRAVVGVTAMTMLFWSFALLPLADATAINYTAPLFLTALSAPLLGEKVGIYRWSAVLVGFIGMLIMLRPGEGMLELGALVALAAAFMQAMAMVAVSQLSRTEASTTIVFYFTAITTVLGALVLPFVWKTPEATYDWLMLLGIGLIGGCSQLSLTRAYAHAQAAVIAPFTYASLLWAALFGWLLWGHVPDDQTVLGAVVVAVSGVYITYREAVRKKAAASKP